MIAGLIMGSNEESDQQRQARLEAEAQSELNEELSHELSNRVKDGKAGPLKRMPVLFRFFSIFGSSSQAGMSGFDRQED